MIPAPILQVWDETGTDPLGTLAGFSALTVSDVLSDLGSLALTAPRDVTGVDLLMTDEDRQVRLVMQGCPDMWWVLDDDESTRISDDPDSEDIRFAFRSLPAVLAEAVVIPSGGIGATPAEWAFDADTPGLIFKTLFDSAQGRGLLQGITLANGVDLATEDAAGSAWPESTTQTYRAGTSLLDVLKSLTDLGLVEWRMNGRSLELHQTGGGLDRTLDVALRPTRDVTSAPLVRTRRDIATAAVVEGADGETVRRTQTLTGRRAREVYVAQSSAPSTALNQVGDLYLAAHAAPNAQITHELTDGDDSPVPWRDYRCGDRLMTLAAGPQVTLQRVAQIAADFTDTGAKVTLELGSILQTVEERVNAQLRLLLPRSTTV